MHNVTVEGLKSQDGLGLQHTHKKTRQKIKITVNNK
jgi:hypothetical protein